MQSQPIETPRTDEIREYKMLIGGEWGTPAPGRPSRASTSTQATRDPFKLG